MNKKKTAAFPAAEGPASRHAGEERRFYTYMLRCADGSIYTGWTTDLARRLAAHNAGTASRYTRSRRPVELACWEEAASKEEAMSREWHWKRLTRAQKLEMISIKKNSPM